MIKLDDTFYTKQYNGYIRYSFLKNIFNLYLVWCAEKQQVPEYTEEEFSYLKKEDFSEEFINNLLYHAELMNVPFNIIQD